MNNPQMYVEELRKLYDCRKIGVNREGITFDCEHSVCCKAAAAKDKGRSLCRGAEAHVGEKYGDPIRIVFISLDTGGSENEYGADLLERRKTIQAVTYRGANPHMRGTIATLKHLYGCRPESDLLTRFAMTNSAKCSWKDDDANMVPNKLYKNCREHGLAELKELNPQLVVTQGRRAEDLLKSQYQDVDEREIQERVPNLTWGDAEREHLKYWENEAQFVPVLQCPHPSARYGRWQRFETTMLPALAHFLRQWFPDLDDFFRSCEK